MIIILAINQLTIISFRIESSIGIVAILRSIRGNRMKKILTVAGFLIVSLSCGGGESTSRDADYKLKPGSLTPTTFNQEFDVDFAGSNYTGANFYAVLFKGKAGTVNYIGLSLDTDGKPGDSSGFNLKLYYESSTIPTETTITLTKGINGFIVKAKSGATSYNEIDDSDNSITLNFSEIDANNIVTITASSPTNTLALGGQTLAINTIKAYVYK